jgi:D-alanyl-lipoteichoic acid acyltransferase DltB (MBOAT superfamily)
MIFNSYTFYIFLPIVFLIFWRLPKQEYRNAWLLIASYVFYGWWDWRFLSLIIASSFWDFWVGIRLEKAGFKQKKYWVASSLVFNLGLLGYFKYHNFFVDSLRDFLLSIGLNFNYSTLDIILPVGISFYTFQTLSYSLDIYQGKLEPTKDWLSFFTFVSFFPQLVAGPIERASHLLPQFFSKKEFNYAWAVDGARLMLWGLFKKVVIADNLAYAVDSIFGNYENKAAWVLYEGLVFFAFQIYCDFSGYSDIARGVARWFGIDIMRNFNRPYFATSFRDFWSRWHISLSTWFKDYVYIPLGGNRNGEFHQLKNLGITFVLSGLWHGANWTFVTWGFLHAIYYIPETLIRNVKSFTFSIPNWLKRFFVFHFVLVAWAYFRSPSISIANDYVSKTIIGIFAHPGSVVFFKWYFGLVLVAILLITELLIREREHPFLIKKTLLRWCTYTISILLILWYQAYHTTSAFIYFQF